MDLRAIRLLVLDVDGVLTPGDVTYPESESRIMRFNIHDGCAIKNWTNTTSAKNLQATGPQRSVAIISGKESPAVTRRAAELGINPVLQGVSEKGPAMAGLLHQTRCESREACFIGDDRPDLDAMALCTLKVAVANAVPDVKRHADFITRRPGGGGAVAELIDWLLSKQGLAN
jgi:3-deoxy-D-manno-octulosonate 8-phosphate phosphatase (KDO 8-P phosphatase)